MRVMYYLFRKYMAAGTDVSFSQRTINQLINSGNLRLIKDISISDSIVSYDINIQKILQQYIIFHDQYQQTAREISKAYGVSFKDTITLAADIAATGKQVILVKKVDADLIGGFVLTVGDKQFDTSIAKSLVLLKKEFNS
mgnify:CR=1 FL=1